MSIASPPALPPSLPPPPKLTGSFSFLCCLQVGQWTASKKFWKHLFSTDHIYLNEGHITTLQTMFEQEALEVNYGTFPYVPSLLRCPYYYFIGKKK